MTDPLSIAAAATGFLSLSGHVTDGLVKLRRFYNTSRHAPEEVGKLISSMQDLQELLDIVEGELNNPCATAGLDHQAVRTCLSRCQTLQTNFKTRLNHLDDKFKRRRSNQIAMLFQKVEIERTLDEIERCKSSLLIAQQKFGTEVAYHVGSVLTDRYDVTVQQQCRLEQNFTKGNQKLEQQYDSIRQEDMAINQAITNLRKQVADMSGSLNNQRSRDQAVLSAVENTNRTISSLASRYEQPNFPRSETVTKGWQRYRLRRKFDFQLVPLRISVENIIGYGDDEHDLAAAPASPRSSRSAPRETTIVDIRVPFWFAENQYAVCLKKSTSWWTFRPRIYRDVSGYTPFLLACMNGPYTEVQRLLKSSTSVLRDRFDGMTGADYALMSYHLDIYKLLSGQGAKPQMSSEDQIPMMLKRPFRFASRLGDRLEFHSGFGSLVEDFEDRIAFICAESDIEAEEVTEYAEVEGHMNRRGRREYRTILRLIRQYPHWSPAEAVQAGLLVAPALKYVGCRFQRIYERMIDDFKAAYSSRHLLQINNFSEGARTIPHVAALRLGETVALREDTSLWSSLMTESLAAGIDVHMEQQLSYWLPCLIWKPWGTPLGLYCLSLSIQHVPWSHHWSVREHLSSDDKFRIFFGIPDHPMHQQIPPLSPKIVQKIDNGLQFWVTLLESQGVDLESYGETESRLFQEIELQRDFEFEQVTTADSWLCWLSQVRSLHTGPEPGDWHFEYFTHSNDFAEEFWRMTERPAAIEDLLNDILTIKCEVDDMRKNPTDDVPGAWKRSFSLAKLSKLDLVEWLDGMKCEQYWWVANAVREVDVQSVYDHLQLGTFNVVN